MKFSKNLLGSGFQHVYKMSASYRKPSRPLTSMTSRDQKFSFLYRVLTDQKFQDTFRQNSKEYTQVLYIK